MRLRPLPFPHAPNAVQARRVRLDATRLMQLAHVAARSILNASLKYLPPKYLAGKLASNAKSNTL